MDWKTIILIITLVANFFLAFLSYFGSKNEKVNIIWSAAVSAVFFWVFAMIFYRNAGSENALVWCRVLYISATLIPILFLYFTFFYPEGKWLINKKVGFLITLPTFAIILLVILPNIIIKDVMIKPGQEKEIIFGPYYFLYALYISGYFFWSILNLCKKYFKYYGIIKSQIRYILLGTLISIILGSTFNLLMPWFGEFRFNWLGQVTTLFMVSSVSYAIVKRELFGIKLVLVQILVVVIAILLLFQFLASTTFFEYAWKGALLIVFLIFGWLLINSVL